MNVSAMDCRVASLFAKTSGGEVALRSIIVYGRRNAAPHRHHSLSRLCEEGEARRGNPEAARGPLDRIARKDGYINRIISPLS